VLAAAVPNAAGPESLNKAVLFLQFCQILGAFRDKLNFSPAVLARAE
jgi:hypothetical protein